jgi:hypothetical protein
MTCTRCDNSGFLNLHQLPSDVDASDVNAVLEWIKTHDGHDIQVCDCCGDGHGWYGESGEHYKTRDDQPGPNGPYAYNGGLPECA